MTILLVDDHQSTREEIRALVESQPGMIVIAESPTGEDAAVQAHELRPDIVIMDIRLPGMNGIEATRAICADNPGIKVVALSNHFGESLVKAILAAGGKGYVQKSEAFEELIPALLSVAAGAQYFGKPT